MNRGTIIKNMQHDYEVNFEDNENEIHSAPFDAWIIPVEEYNKRGSTILELQNRAESAEAHAAQLEAERDELRGKLEQAHDACKAARDWFEKNTKQGHTPGPVEQKLIDAISSIQKTK